MLKTRPICPPLGEARFLLTSKTCFVLMPSPVKVAWLEETSTVPVAPARPGGPARPAHHVRPPARLGWTA
ncbi:hypothetical protein ACWC9T_17675 [Kitasatospora sp. NPDC001159]